MPDVLQFTIKEALKYIAEYFGVSSMYAISKELSDDRVKVQPIQISNYLKGHKPSRKVARRFLEVYDIVITDVHNPGNLTEIELNKMED